MPSSDTLQAQKAATAAEVAAATAKLYSQAQETYADDAAASATEASASAQSAGDSASLAQQYYSLSLDGVLWFVGSYDTAPTERTNGTALEVGDMYKNTTDNEVYSFNSDGTWSSMNSDATMIQDLYSAGNELFIQGQDLYNQSSEQYDVSVDLYDAISGSEGASNILISQGGTVQSALTYLTPEMFGAKSDGVTDDSNSIILALNAASTSKYKKVVLGSQYLITKQITIPAGVLLQGSGWNSGLIMDAPAAQTFMIYMNSDSCQAENFSIKFKTNGGGNISTVLVYGVMLDSSSTNCMVSDLFICGKYDGDTQGFSNGIRCTGENNVVNGCRIEYCSMGITYRGDSHLIDNNYCNNHFVDENLQAWSSSLPWWDGITAEGATNCVISRNTCEYNGQSGIYMGGNGSLSGENIFYGNIIRYNYNRGMDNGVSGTVSSTNSVSRNVISNNIIYDNKEPQLWLFNVTDFVVDSNNIRISGDYPTIFGSYVSSSTSGIATGGDSISGTIISNNRVSIEYSSAQFRVVMNGLNMSYIGNKVTGTPSDYLWSTDANRLYNNTVSRYSGTFTPSIVAGVGVTISSSTCNYIINDKTMKFSMQITFAGSSPSGNLVLGYLPGMSSATVKISSITTNNANGWSTMSGTLKAYQDGTNKDNLVIYRESSGARNFDAASYVSSASSILITGEIEVSSTY